jgi:hypothetical protein
VAHTSSRAMADFLHGYSPCPMKLCLVVPQERFEKVQFELSRPAFQVREMQKHCALVSEEMFLRTKGTNFCAGPPARRLSRILLALVAEGSNEVRQTRLSEKVVTKRGEFHER